MGVWIETLLKNSHAPQPQVTPFVGVWIETFLRGGGLQLPSVTPFVGVWIETYHDSFYEGWLARHTLRGCVD